MFRKMITAAALAALSLPAVASADWRMTTPVVNSDATNRATTQGVFDTPVPALGDCTTQNYPCSNMKVLADGTAGIPRTMHPAAAGQPNGVWQLVAPDSTRIHAKFYRYFARTGTNPGTYCTRQTLTAGYTLGSVAWAHQVEGLQFKLRNGGSDPYIWLTLQRAGDRGIVHPEGADAPILSVRSNVDSGSGGSGGGYADVTPIAVRTGIPYQTCAVVTGTSWNWYMEQGTSEADSRAKFADDSSLGVHMGDVPFSQVTGPEGAWGGTGYTDIVMGMGHYGYSGLATQYLYLLDASFTAVNPPDPYDPTVGLSASWTHPATIHLNQPAALTWTGGCDVAPCILSWYDEGSDGDQNGTFSGSPRDWAFNGPSAPAGQWTCRKDGVTLTGTDPQPCEQVTFTWTGSSTVNVKGRLKVTNGNGTVAKSPQQAFSVTP
jgi:hypothetical protein